MGWISDLLQIFRDVRSGDIWTRLLLIAVLIVLVLAYRARLLKPITTALKFLTSLKPIPNPSRLLAIEVYTSTSKMGYEARIGAIYLELTLLFSSFRIKPVEITHINFELILDHEGVVKAERRVDLRVPYSGREGYAFNHTFTEAETKKALHIPSERRGVAALRMVIFCKGEERPIYEDRPFQLIVFGLPEKPTLNS